jgi:hypothetical protein
MADIKEDSYQNLVKQEKRAIYRNTDFNKSELEQFILSCSETAQELKQYRHLRTSCLLGAARYADQYFTRYGFGNAAINGAYNDAVRDFVELEYQDILKSLLFTSNPTVQFSSLSARISVVIDTDYEYIGVPDQLISCESRVKLLSDKFTEYQPETAMFGGFLGCAFIGLFLERSTARHTLFKRTRKVSFHISKKGLVVPPTVLPITVLLEFDPSSKTRIISKLRLFTAESFNETSLKRDVSTPIYYQLYQLMTKDSEIPSKFEIIPYMNYFYKRSLYSKHVFKDAPDVVGLFPIEPIDYTKPVLVFVHGFLSNPVTTWAKLIVHIAKHQTFSDKKYQLFCFQYPTNWPVLESARIFRESWKQLMASYPKIPKGNVLLTYSMGGIIAKLAAIVESTTDELLVATLKISNPSVVEIVKQNPKVQRLFYWKPIKHVSKVIFIAVPHGGVEAFSWNTVNIGSKLIDYFKSFFVVLPKHLELTFLSLFQDKGQKFRAKAMKEMGSLAVDSALIRFSNDRNNWINAEHIETYSILGNAETLLPNLYWKLTKIPRNSDGLVSINSSFYAFNKERPFVVNCNHVDIVRKEEVFQKIVQILFS